MKSLNLRGEKSKLRKEKRLVHGWVTENKTYGRPSDVYQSSKSNSKPQKSQNTPRRSSNGNGRKR